jgi:K+/H+ antiporter YhaU regulatory subunit KhtT
MNYEQAIKELRDNLIVIAEIERRQSALLREHSENIAELLEFRRRTEQNLAEITDKLNGLIGYMDGLRPPSPS